MDETITDIDLDKNLRECLWKNSEEYFKNKTECLNELKISNDLFFSVVLGFLTFILSLDPIINFSSFISISYNVDKLMLFWTFLIFEFWFIIILILVYISVRNKIKNNLKCVEDIYIQKDIDLMLKQFRK